MGCTSLQLCKGYMVTFQLYLWRKASGATLPLCAFFQAQAGTWVEPPMFHKQDKGSFPKWRIQTPWRYSNLQNYCFQSYVPLFCNCILSRWVSILSLVLIPLILLEQWARLKPLHDDDDLAITIAWLFLQNRQA